MRKLKTNTINQKIRGNILNPKPYETDGDILKVKYLLGHKRLDTTGRYAHYQAFKKEEYITKRTKTREEDQLLNEGYKFI